MRMPVWGLVAFASQGCYAPTLPALTEATMRRVLAEKIPECEHAANVRLVKSMQIRGRHSWFARCGSLTYQCWSDQRGENCGRDPDEVAAEERAKAQRERAAHDDLTRRERAAWESISAVDRRIVCATRQNAYRKLILLGPEQRRAEKLWTMYEQFDEDTKAKVLKQDITVAMPYLAVILALGPPLSENRTTTENGTNLQMVYSLVQHARCGLWSTAKRIPEARMVYIYIAPDGRVAAIQH